jgi:hypothetical protein
VPKTEDISFEYLLGASVNTKKSALLYLDKNLRHLPKQIVMSHDYWITKEIDISRIINIVSVKILQ